MSSEVFLQGTDPSSFWRTVFSILRPMPNVPPKVGETPQSTPKSREVGTSRGLLVTQGELARLSCRGARVYFSCFYSAFPL